MLLPMDDMIDALNAQGRKLTGDPTYTVNSENLLRGLNELLDDQASKGFKFRGIIYAPILKSGALLNFEPTRKVFKYKIFDSYGIAHCENTKDLYAEIEKLGDIHATIMLWNIFPSPLYVVGEEQKTKT